MIHSRYATVEASDNSRRQHLEALTEHNTREYILKNFDKGLITRIEDFSIPKEAASSSLNWLTLGDKIELTGGYSIIGTENGAGKITGLAVGEKVDGTTQPIRTRGQKIEYYNNPTTDWVESGTNLLGVDADGEDTSITFYTSLAGYQAWISSPSSSLFKMMLANPGSIKDLGDANGVYRGFVDAQNGRLHLWNRLNNKNYLYGSWIDLQDSTVYTSVTAEAVGSAPTQTFAGTLTAVTGDRTCFNVVFTDGTQRMTDNKNGAFIGDGTGTINYATGAYSITFTAATTGSTTVNYSWELSTTHGLADFSFTTPIRIAGEGFFLPQPTGGDLLTVAPYRTEFYCLHRNTAWLFSMPVDDLYPTNQIFRQNIGLASTRAAVATGDGIYYVDLSNPSEPRFKLLTLESSNDQVVPTEFSFNVDLSGYSFTNAVMYQWGDYILCSCAVTGETVNNRVFVYHKTYKTFDVTDYFVSVFADRAGDLWAGEFSTDNVVQLFTGFSANGSLVNNFWEGKLTDLQVEELKKFKRLTITGQIGVAQSINVLLSYDGGDFASVGTIDGDGSYVDSAPVATVGSPQVASLEVAGGGNGIEAFGYVREFRVRSTKFDNVKIRFQATDVGYASVSEINFYDIETYGQKNLTRYRQTS